ncbi:MAG TPA: hypothetical protein VLU06_06530 [Thermoanaerobaculia bacterium]|nr:hypothetical protein [Thermoanaerobaculia bacterium]
MLGTGKLMAPVKDSNKPRFRNFPGRKVNWHAVCFVCTGMSPLDGQFRSGRTAIVLVLLLLAVLALEIWGIRVSLLGILR